MRLISLGVFICFMVPLLPHHNTFLFSNKTKEHLKPACTCKTLLLTQGGKFNNRGEISLANFP